MPRESSQLRQSLSNEASLLLACIRAFLGTGDSDEINAACQKPIVWPEFIRLARVHRVIGPVVRGLLGAGGADISQKALEELKELHQAGSRRSLFLIGQLIETLRSLECKGIGAISFKGPILSLDAWGDPAIRGSGDLDLLIHRADMPAARELLIAHGFVPVFPTSTPAEAEYLSSLTGRRLARYVDSHSEHHLMHPEGRINIDLHWDITLRQFAVPLDSERLWKNSRQVAMAGASVPTLGLEDLLLVLCINAAKDCWLHLDRVCDVAALIQRNKQIDVVSLFGEAKEIGAGRMVLVTLALASEMLDIALPERVGRQIAADPVCRKLTAEIIGKMFGPEQSSRLDETSLQLRARDRLSSRLRYVLAQCHPTVGDWSAVPLPQGLGFLHFLLRPIRLLLQLDTKAR